MRDLEEVAKTHEQDIETVLKRISYSAIRSYELSDLVRLPDSAEADIEAAMRKVWRNAILWRGQPFLEEFRSYGFEHLETKADEDSVFDRALNFFIETFSARKVFQILETSRNQIMKMIKVGLDEGLTQREIAKTMREAIPELSANRAISITRTETHQAGGFAQQAVAKESRRPLVKTWNAVDDHRTRALSEGDAYDHRNMDGVTVPMNEPYYVMTRFGTREPLMFPGDPNGSAGNVINCRCVETYKRAEIENG